MKDKLTWEQIDDLLSDLFIKGVPVDKKGKVKYSDMHEAIMQVRIKIKQGLSK